MERVNGLIDHFAGHSAVNHSLHFVDPGTSVQPMQLKEIGVKLNFKFPIKIDQEIKYTYI
jgi:hypothetical protein